MQAAQTRFGPRVRKAFRIIIRAGEARAPDPSLHNPHSRHSEKAGGRREDTETHANCRTHFPQYDPLTRRRKVYSWSIWRYLAPTLDTRPCRW